MASTSMVVGWSQTTALSIVSPAMCLGLMHHEGSYWFVSIQKPVDSAVQPFFWGGWGQGRVFS